MESFWYRWIREHLPMHSCKWWERMVTSFRENKDGNVDASSQGQWSFNPVSWIQNISHYSLWVCTVGLNWDPSSAYCTVPHWICQERYGMCAGHVQLIVLGESRSASAPLTFKFHDTGPSYLFYSTEITKNRGSVMVRSLCAMQCQVELPRSMRNSSPELRAV